MRSNYKRLGDYIALVDERNVDLEVTTLLGLSISKQFIPSVANTIGTDMKNYKIIRKNQFACSVMQVRRDGKMPVALLRDFDEAIISQAYPVFEVVDISLLLPEYLMMWFTRSEFDRQATFHAVGGVRGSLEWDDFMDFEMPIPSIETQQEIVDEYHTITKRIDLNEQLNQKLEDTAQALYRHWFADFEFPIDLFHTERSRSASEDGIINKINYSKGYKSSGGAMVYNEELDGNIPEGWEIEELDEFNFDISDGNYSAKYPKASDFLESGIPFIRGTDFENKSIDPSNLRYISTEQHSKLRKGHTKPGDVIITTRGASIGAFGYITKEFVDVNINSQLVRINGGGNYSQFYLGLLFNSTDFKNAIGGAITGSAQPQLSIKNLIEMRILKPPIYLCQEFTEKYDAFLKCFFLNNSRTLMLKRLKELLLSKMATVESEEEIIN